MLDQDSLERLAAPALRLFFGLADAWSLDANEQMRLLGLESPDILVDLKSGKAGVSPDMIERISYLLGIFKAVNTLLPAYGRADAWMRAPSSAPPFNGRSALEVMTSGEIDDLRSVRRYVDAQLI